MEKLNKYERLAKAIPGVQAFYNLIKKRRYKYLYETIRQYRCRTIMEIGLWDGQHALKMIKTARSFFGNDVHYYGFDLFEDMSDATYAHEVSKCPSSLSNIQIKLEKTGCQIKLFKGYSQQTLPRALPELPKMDLIFIDGGHSLETIASDWEYSQSLMHERTVVIFDDYWNREDIGCKPIVDNIDRGKYRVTILPRQDRFKKDWGTLTINFAKVTLA